MEKQKGNYCNILGLYWGFLGIIGVILGLYWKNGKENGNYYIMIGYILGIRSVSPHPELHWMDNSWFRTGPSVKYLGSIQEVLDH